MSVEVQNLRFRLLYFMAELKKSDQLWRFVGLGFGFGFAAVIGVFYGLSVESKQEGGPLGRIEQLQRACKKSLRLYNKNENDNRGIIWNFGSNEFYETGNGKVWVALTNQSNIEVEKVFYCDNGKALTEKEWLQKIKNEINNQS